MDISTQATPPRGATGHVFSCPYCNQDVFNDYERLLEHVVQDHRAQVERLGFRRDTDLFKMLLRDEGLHQAYVSYHSIPPYSFVMVGVTEFR